MKFSSLQKKKPLVINTKIIIKLNNEKYSLQKSSLPIDNILSITRLYSLYMTTSYINSRTINHYMIYNYSKKIIKNLENIKLVQKLYYLIKKSYIRRKHLKL
jgi:hypothetical protein